MKTHHLKTLPVYFDAVYRGDKTFEIRENDRDFQTGGMLVLQEFDPSEVKDEPGTPPRAPEPWKPRPIVGLTGREITVTVTYTLHGGQYGLDPAFVVMGFGVHAGAVMAVSK